MEKPTKLEMDGMVNWERMDALAQLGWDEFYDVPEDERCGAWHWINGARDALYEAFTGKAPNGGNECS